MTPKSISRYPEYMITAALSCDRPLIFELPTPKAAQSLRFTFYALRRAIYAEHAEATFPHFIRANLRVEGNNLIISPPETSEMEKVFQKTFANAGISYPPKEPLPAEETSNFDTYLESWMKQD